MRVSFVVPAWNEARLIGATLGALREAIAHSALAGTACEILVVDNASTDATPRIAADAGARVVFEAERQIARARNTGARDARGEWLVFLDADCRPDAGLLDALAAEIRDGCAAGGGATVRMEELPVWWMRGVLCSWNGISRSLRWAAGSFFWCRAEAFRAVGGFDERLYAGEEIDLSRRVKRWARARGLRFVVLHRHPLLTSARKARLYSAREILSTMARMVRHPRRFFRSREDCFLWYDGRR